MPGYGNPNRPEWTGKRKAKNFARINAACKGLKTSGGKPPTDCPKCGTSHKFAACPVCGSLPIRGLHRRTCHVFPRRL